MNKALILLSLLTATSVISGCGSSSDSPFVEGGSSSGKIEAGNFSFGSDPANTNPATITVTYGDGTIIPAEEIVSIDSVTGGTELKFNVLAGDRFGRSTSGSSITFVANYGNYDQSCTLNSSGSCTMNLITNGTLPLPPGFLYNGFVDPFDNASNQTIYVTAVAYTTGEESFFDVNGNGYFDDGDVFTHDVSEPYLDNNTNFQFDENIDTPIDLDNSGGHTPADGLYSGSGCRHSTLCSSSSSTVIWDSAVIDLVN